MTQFAEGAMSALKTGVDPGVDAKTQKFYERKERYRNFDLGLN